MTVEGLVTDNGGVSGGISDVIVEGLVTVQ